MYIFLGALMASTWANTGYNQNEIQDRLGLMFFAVAFPCFMAVAGIAGFLEERELFIREFQNGSYSVLAYVMANTVVMIPFIFLIAFIFTLIIYPSTNLNDDPQRAAIFGLLMFLLLLVAESLTLLVSAILPIFVASLAIVSFINGFFMVVEGFFIRYENLPKFWIWGHYWAYHKYGFEAMAKNDFEGRNFDCEIMPTINSCNCYFP